MKYLKKTVGILCAACLLLAVLTPGLAAESGTPEQPFTRSRVYAGGQFSDVSTGDWFAPSVKDAYELGLMDGVGGGVFNPSGPVQVSEVVALCCRLHSIYSGGDGSFPQAGGAWYQVYVDYAAEHGILQEGQFQYNVPATRWQCAVLLDAALPPSALPAVNSVARWSIPDVEPEARYMPAVYRLYNAGIFSGSDDAGSFRPDASILRCEIAAVASRMADPALRQTFSLAQPDYSVMTGARLAYLDLESAPEALRPQILRARLPIIYDVKQGWSVDGAADVMHSDGTVEKLPEFSDLWPEWTVPFGPEWRKYDVMDPNIKGTSFYTSFQFLVGEKTGYWDFILQNDGETGCYFTIEGEGVSYTSEVIPAHTRQRVLCAPGQPLPPGSYNVSVHSEQEGVSPEGTIWTCQVATYEELMP